MDDMGFAFTNLKYENKESPLDVAVRNKNLEIVKLLLENNGK